MQMLALITRAPFWVWPLFFILLFFGLKARKVRVVHVAILYALPLLGILSLRSVAQLAPPAMVWGLFALGYLAGGTGGFRFQKKIVLARQGVWVRLAGEWLTLAMLMVIFWMNYVGGIMAVVAPATSGALGFQAVFGVGMAAAAGIILGRAVRVFCAGGAVVVAENHI